MQRIVCRVPCTCYTSRCVLVSTDVKITAFFDDIIWYICCTDSKVTRVLKTTCVELPIGSVASEVCSEGLGSMVPNADIGVRPESNDIVDNLRGGSSPFSAPIKFQSAKSKFCHCWFSLYRSRV